MTGFDDKIDGARTVDFDDDVGEHDEDSGGNGGDLGEDDCAMAEKSGTGMDEGAPLVGDVDTDDNSLDDKNF
jgi:hypothetical protein